jgi:phage terminase large subunit-like protein
MNESMGMRSESSTIENGFVYIPTQAERLAEYLREIAVIRKGKDNDRVDATSPA